jgi:hypothetical protein
VTSPRFRVGSNIDCMFECYLVVYSGCFEVILSWCSNYVRCKLFCILVT